jgi:hypothetical protein
MHLTKLSTAAACIFMTLIVLPQTAVAATYMMPVQVGGEANGSILKITVANGTIRRVGQQDGVLLYEVEMEGNACSRDVRVIFSDSDIATATIAYNVCSEEGFGININWSR